MGLSWNREQLASLRQKFAQVANGGFRRDLHQVLAEEARSLIIDGFRKSEDPYGKPWKGSMQRARGRGQRGMVLRTQGQILRNTGRLLNGFHATANEKGFTVENEVAYAAIHNFGGPVTVGARVNAHAKSGRFARKAPGKRGKATRISFTAAHSFLMPRRQMVPDPGNLGPTWTAALNDAFKEALENLFGRSR